MAQKKHNVMLTSSFTPLDATAVAAHAIMVGAEAQNYRRLIPDAQQDANAKLPQTLYVENALPTPVGWSSFELVDINASTPFEDSVLVELKAPIVTLLGPTAADVVHVAIVGDSADTYWTLQFCTATEPWQYLLDSTNAYLGSAIDVVVGSSISKCRVNGHEFLVMSEIDVASPWDGSVVLWGYSHNAANRWCQLSYASVDLFHIYPGQSGHTVISASGYLIICGNNSIAWSSAVGLFPADIARDTDYIVGDQIFRDGLRHTCTVGGTTATTTPVWYRGTATAGDETDGTTQWSQGVMYMDFAPSDITGAGGGSVEELEGTITAAIPYSGGFMLYTQNNVVACMYSNNASYPFVFKRVTGAGGVVSPRFVTHADASLGHYAYTTKGLQLIAPAGAKAVFPEWSRSIGWVTREGSIPQYGYSGSAVVVTDVAANLAALALCAGRYLVADCGEIKLVYDLQLQRAGMIYSVLSFVYAHQWQQDVAATDLFPESSGTIGLCQADGTLYAIRNAADGGGDGDSRLLMTLILGNYKHVAEQDITMLNVELSAVVSSIAMTVTAAYLLTSYDGRTWGKTTAIAQGTDSVAASGYVNLECCEEGVMHAVMVVGTFDLCGAMLTYTSAGHTR
jgi:hypothetical protein